MIHPLRYSLILSLALSLAGCRSPSGGDADGDVETDGDVERERDGDADSDADPDGDADTDTAPDGDADTDGDADLEADGDGDADGDPPCPRDPAPADRTRYVVISHPYDAEGGEAADYEVFALSPEGELVSTGRTFTMRRAFLGEIVFTPDGEIGLVAHDDGTVGVFRLAPDGAPEVIHEALAGEVYASSVVMDPSGERAYVLDTEWRVHGGGIYEVTIGCDGRVVEEGLVAAGQMVASLLWLGGGRALAVADDILESTSSDEAHLLSWGDDPVVLDGVDAFGDDEAIVSAAALTADGRYALIGDANAFSGIPNRVALVEVLEDGSGLSATGVLSPLEDPIGIVASPFDDAVLVVSGFGNALWALSYDPGAVDEPLVVAGELDYAGPRPQLPAGAVLVSRGSLSGLVLVAENTAIRRVRFQGDGSIADLGPTSTGEGFGAVVGAIGVQP